MTYGGMTIIVAGVLLGLAGWAAAAYSTYQVRQHKAAIVNSEAIRKTNTERVVSIDVTGDFVMTARQKEPGASASRLSEGGKRRHSGTVSADRYDVYPGVKIPRDPVTGKILTFDQLPMLHVEQELDQPTIESRV